jgi:hypothetical protein
LSAVIDSSEVEPLAVHRSFVTGALSGFDRLVFQHGRP